MRGQEDQVYLLLINQLMQRRSDMVADNYARLNIPR
jgi:hypothetical protein